MTSGSGASSDSFASTAPQTSFGSDPLHIPSCSRSSSDAPSHSAITSSSPADGPPSTAVNVRKKSLTCFDSSPEGGNVFPLGYLPGEESIFHSLAARSDGSIYIGTSLVNVGRVEERGQDVLARYEGYAGGHIYRFDPAAELTNRKRMQHPQPNRALGFYQDLGIPVPGQAVVCLVTNEDELYGVTFPGGNFFVANPMTGETEDKGPIAGPPLNEEPFSSIPRALVIDEAGRVWGAGDYGALFHYDPDSEEIVHHPSLRLPSEPGREFKTILDAMVRGPEDVLYGGTSDGFVFRFDPSSSKVTNLGKPMSQYRVRGLAFSKDGDLYGVGKPGRRRGATIRLSNRRWRVREPGPSCRSRSLSGVSSGSS